MASTTYKVNITGDATELKNATNQAEDALKGVDNAVNNTTGGKGNDPLDQIGKKIDMNNLMQAGETVAQMGDKVLELGKKSIEASAEQNAMNSTFKQTFGELTPFATNEVNKLSKAYDILPNRIKPSYQQFTSMFKGLGLSTQDASEKATQAMRISANAAAFYDKSLEDSNSALQSFVKGNYEGGESIGLFANETQMQAYAVKNNLIPATEGQKQASEEMSLAVDKAQQKATEAIAKHGEGSIEARDATLKLKKAQDDLSAELAPQAQKWADLDEATKQSVRLEYAENMMVQAGAIDEVGKMTGQASRESGEYENQMGNMKQTIQDLLATIGSDILPTFLEVLKMGIGVVQTLAKAFESLPQPVKQFIFIFGGLLALLGQLAPIITAVIAVVTTVGAVPIAIVLAIIGAIAGLLVVIKNWGAITEWLGEKWNALLSWLGSSSIWDSITGVISGVWNTIKDTLSGIWDSIVQVATGIFNGMKDTLSGIWESITTTLTTVWNNLVTIVSPIFETIKNVITVVFMTIQSVISGIWLVITSMLQVAWNLIVSMATTIFTPIANFFSGLWNGIKDVASNVWTAISSWFSTAWASIVATATTIFTPIANFFSGLWNGIKNVASNVWGAVTSTLTNLWNGLKNTATNVFNALANFFSGLWNGIKNVASNVWSSITGTLSNVWNGIKTTATNIFNAVAQTISSIWNGIKNTLSNIVNGIKNTVANVFNAMKSTISNTFNSIKTAMTSPIERAKDTISNIVNTIKGFFNNIRLKLPKIDMPPLPHFSLTGSFSLKPPSVPKLSVNWYAKGGVFNSPSVIGVGEAGEEAVLPLKDSVLGKIAQGINRNFSGQTMEKEIYPTQPIINQVSIDWHGDVDNLDRLNDLTEAIVERITDNNNPAFS